MPLVRQFSTARFAGLGVTSSPSQLDLTGGSSGSPGGTDTNSINNDIKFGQGIVNAVTAGETRDKVRQNRVNVISSLALAGSVLAAQICLAGPANVASNEQPYWTAAQQAIQQRRPDVWAAAQQAGPWWPVGQPFDMTAARQEICMNLANSGITVNSAACNAVFGTGCTDQGGSCSGVNPIMVTVTGAGTQVVNSPPPSTYTGPGPTTTVPTNIAGFSSPILLLAIAGAAAYYFISQRKRG